MLMMDANSAYSFIMSNMDDPISKAFHQNAHNMAFHLRLQMDTAKESDRPHFLLQVTEWCQKAIEQDGRDGDCIVLLASMYHFIVLEIGSRLAKSNPEMLGRTHAIITYWYRQKPPTSAGLCELAESLCTSIVNVYIYITGCSEEAAVRVVAANHDVFLFRALTDIHDVKLALFPKPE